MELPTSRPGTDSSLQRSAGVGSDDSTAVRVRVPSTMDFVATPIAAPEIADGPQARPGNAAELRICRLGRWHERTEPDLYMNRFFGAIVGLTLTIGTLWLRWLRPGSEASWLCWSWSCSAGAGDPDIVAVPLPAKDVSKYFPAGTELRRHAGR